MSDILSSFKGLGPKRREALFAKGICTDEQLLAYFPCKYMDYAHVKPIAACASGEEAAFDVRVRGRPTQARVHGKMITRAVLYDESGKINAVWFNSPWMYQKLWDADTLTVFGRVENKNGRRNLICPRIVTEKIIEPAYKPIPGVPGKLMRDLMKAALREMDETDILPEKLIKQYNLLPRREALWQIHFPTDMQTLEKAVYRFSFEDMLLFMISARRMRREKGAGEAIDWNEKTLKTYTDSLRFPLTNAQKRVLSEIGTDMASSSAMARLVQGDVGCGKTAVAFGAIYMTAMSGFQSAMMAPTEILARQHYESAKEVLEPLGVKCGLLIGSMTAKERKEAFAHLSDGSWQAVFGTHALISKGVEYRNLALAVTDEQHRFGVRQRTALGEKGTGTNVLVMSATPIPRTLSLILFGDLDISIIDELPPGRKTVKTRIVKEEKREAMYGFILDEIKRGKQAYFVCPLVEDSESVDALSAEGLSETLMTGPLSGTGVTLVHGKMTDAEREAALEAFRSGETSVLVSTTVIEVGINVPNATVMVVENAERFGLAQLHQLRGRVGRGTDEAWCFLMSGGTEKLSILTKTNDGFVIAEKDMELRGPGDLFGTQQSGAISGLSPSVNGDTALLELTHELAKDISESDKEEDKLLCMIADRWIESRSDVIFAAN